MKKIDPKTIRNVNAYVRHRIVEGLDFREALLQLKKSEHFNQEERDYADQCLVSGSLGELPVPRGKRQK